MTVQVVLSFPFGLWEKSGVANSTQERPLPQGGFEPWTLGETERTPGNIELNGELYCT